MMVGIGLGIMVILGAVGLISGGIFRHHEWQDQGNQPVIQQNYDHPEAAEPSFRGRSLEEQGNRSVPWTTTEESGEGERGKES